MANLAPLDPSALIINKATSLKPIPANDSSLQFGRSFTDHMLSIEWTLESGWAAPVIKPYGPLDLDPAASVLHHALCLFEGMKAFKDKNGVTRMFRPDMNMKRMNRSAARLTFPQFDPAEMAGLIKKLVTIDERWIPNEEGYSLYIRPTMIASRANLGGGRPATVLFYVILCPVGPYHPQGYKPVSLLATTDLVRAWPGGHGGLKLGANYAGSYQPQEEAAERGHQAVLWLFGPDHAITEVGMMNFMVVLKKEDGTVELATCPLNDMILPGVTRDSILSLARSHADPTNSTRIAGLPDKLIVSERTILMSEVVEAAKAGTLVEAFGCGTAAIVSSVNNIEYKGENVPVPVQKSGLGELTAAFLREIVGRQRGDIESEWSVVV
ncbi:hypothetical protein MNV49_002098 [Pseudohyphozyma bogoriensis]|nr:hypothetical protein MNV49_002098 [Pseudohyphozyma bogoriensis]